MILVLYNFYQYFNQSVSVVGILSSNLATFESNLVHNIIYYNITFFKINRFFFSLSASNLSTL